MSLANKMAGAARVAVDNARKTADQALHDRAALRRRVGSTVRDAPLTAVRYTMKGVGQALSIGGRMRQGIGDVRSSGVGGLMTRFTRRDAEEKPGTAPSGTESGRSAFEKAAGTESPFDDTARPEGVRPARRARTSRPAETPGTTSTGAGTGPKDADTTGVGTAGTAGTKDKGTAGATAAPEAAAPPATSATESSANAVAAAGSPAATQTPSPGKADAAAPTSGKTTGAAKKAGGGKTNGEQATGTARGKAGGAASKASNASGKATSKTGGAAGKAAGTDGSAATGTGGAGADLPVPEYDSRTVASLRARMRGLSLDDVRRLLEYEHNHAARPEVIGMFERRIAKLEAE